MNFDLNHGLLEALRMAGIEQTPYILCFIGFSLLSLIAGYLLGSVNTAIIVSKVLYKDDIRRHGSGNAGLTNMFRTYGKGAAGLTLLGDMLKTALAIAIGGCLLGFGYIGGISIAGDGGVYIAGLFAVVGHIFPCYYKLKGGKGVLVTATMALILSPVVFGVLFLVFALIVALTKYVSLGSVTAAILYPVALYAYVKICFPAAPMPGMMALSSILIAILIVYCHRENLKRIQNRTERQFSFKKKPEHTDEEEK